MKWMIVVVLATSACVEGQAVDWPNELAVGWECRFEGERLLGCETLVPTSGSARARSNDERIMLVSLTKNALLEIEPRVDLDRLEQIELTSTPEGVFDSSLCQRYGKLESDDRVLRAFDSLAVAPEVHELSRETSRFEALDPAVVPQVLRTASLMIPIRPCGETTEIEMQPFGAEFVLGFTIADDEHFGARPLDDDHWIIASWQTFSLIERGRAEPLWQEDFDETGISALLPPSPPSEAKPWVWTVRDLALGPARDGHFAGVAVFTEFRDRDPQEDDLGQSVIVRFELDSNGLRASALLASIDADESIPPGRGLEKIELEPRGGYIAVGYHLVVTSTSIDGTPRVQTLDGLFAERLLLTSDARYPHVLGGQGGIVYVGDARRGLADLQPLGPFGDSVFPIRGLAMRVDRLGRKWIHASSDQGRSSRWPLGTADFEELPVWVPNDDALACGDVDMPVCGRIRTRHQVRSLGLLDQGGETFQVFSSHECTGVFALSLKRGCSISASQDEDPIQGLRSFRSNMTVHLGDRLMIFGSRRAGFDAALSLGELRLHSVSR